MKDMSPDESQEPRRSDDVPVARDPSAIPGAEPKYDYVRMLAGVVAGVAILAIGVFSLTDLSSVVLPMDEAYLEVLVPRTEDGTYPFILEELSHELSGNTVSITGRVQNNSLEDLENVLAVVRVEETTGRFPATLEIPVDPSPLPAGESGRFETAVTLPQLPDEYSVRFKLEDGPFVPHVDNRAGRQEIAIPDDGEPIRLNIPN